MIKLLRIATALVVPAFMLACGDDSTGVELADLAGMWNATRFEYTDNANPQLSVDAISQGGGTVTLDVRASGGFSGGIFVPGITVDPSSGQDITLPLSGTLSVRGDVLIVDLDAVTEALGLFSDFEAPFELSGDVLTFVHDDVDFDFPDTIEQQAGLPARGAVPATLTTRWIR